MFDWMQQSEENVAQIFPDWLQQSEENCGHLDCPGSMPGNRGLYTLFLPDPAFDFRFRITKSNYIYYNIKFLYVNRISSIPKHGCGVTAILAHEAENCSGYLYGSHRLVWARKQNFR